jgi:WD40 repeat protein
MSKIKQKQFPVWLFGIVFLVILGILILRHVFSPAAAQIDVPNDAGMGKLLTQGQHLIAVFQDGKVAAWDWKNPLPEPLWQFPAGSDRLVILDDNHIAAVTKTDRKQCVVYELKTGKKISETPVGWEDQDIWLVQSPDRKVLALACVNPDKEGHTLYEFALLDPAKGKPDMPVSIDVITAQKRFIAFALSNDKKILAAGSAGKHGWLTVAGLTKGKVILEKEYEQTGEFTSVEFVPDGSQAFLTNRDGSVYGIDSNSGEIKSTYTVLKPGEKNPVTNETTSQNITISEDGKLVAAVVINIIHVWESATGNPVFQQAPGHMLTGPIAFSSDNSLLASSDLRAGRVIRIWKIKK